MLSIIKKRRYRQANISLIVKKVENDQVGKSMEVVKPGGQIGTQIDPATDTASSAWLYRHFVNGFEGRE
jgi:hypothetical protein